MEYYPGETLGEYMDRNGRIPETAALGLMRIVLEALEEVHRERNGERHIHRDMKPSNVYLAAIGASVVPKLLDFGAARTAVGERTQNLTQVLTPGYAPFEQYHSRGAQGPWTDVYACAATLYHMLTAERPAGAPDRYQGEEIATPRDLVPELSEATSRAVMKGLELDRQNRPASAAEFQSMLTAASDALDIGSPPRAPSTAAPVYTSPAHAAASSERGPRAAASSAPVEELFPQYPGSEPFGSHSISTGSGVIFWEAFASDDPPEMVIAHYVRMVGSGHGDYDRQGSIVWRIPADHPTRILTVAAVDARGPHDRFREKLRHSTKTVILRSSHGE